MRATHRMEVEDVTRLCPIWKWLAIAGGAFVCTGMYLFSHAQSAEVERAVIKTQIERMAHDVQEIKRILENAIKEGRR